MNAVTVAVMSAGLAVSLAASAARAQKYSFGEEVRYPTEFKSVVVTTPGGGTRTIVIPSGFTTRKTGATARIEHVGVARLVARMPSNKLVYELAFEDGRTVKATTGETVVIDGEPYLALGRRGSDFCLMSSKTRALLRFRGTPP